MNKNLYIVNFSSSPVVFLNVCVENFVISRLHNQRQRIEAAQILALNMCKCKQIRCPKTKYNHGGKSKIHTQKLNMKKKNLLRNNHILLNIYMVAI